MERPLLQQPKPSAPESTLILRDYYQPEQGKLARIDITSGSITWQDSSGAENSIGLDDIESYSQIEEEIRQHIARKISLLVPMLVEEDRNYLLGYTLKILCALAEDQAARVRRIIAEELKSSKRAPEEIIRILAWDDECDVATPVLEYSPLLADHELLDILSTTHLPWVAEAISKRSQLSTAVSDAIIMTEQATAIQNLLENQHAKISDDGMEDIVALAPQHQHWHMPLASREDLTLNTINRIAEFITHTTFRRLEELKEVPNKNLRSLKKAVHRRLQEPQWDRKRSAEVLTQDLFYRGQLNPERVMQAVEEREEEFIYYALGLLSGLGYDKARKMLTSNNAKAVTSLVWKAGLSMRDSIQIQQRLARIPHKAVLYAKDGVDYPLSDAQMQEYLDFFS